MQNQDDCSRHFILSVLIHPSPRFIHCAKEGLGWEPACCSLHKGDYPLKKAIEFKCRHDKLNMSARLQ